MLDDFLEELAASSNNNKNEPKRENICAFNYCDNITEGKYCSIECELEDLIIEQNNFLYSDLFFKENIDKIGDRQFVEQIFKKYIDYRNDKLENDKSFVDFKQFLSGQNISLAKEVNETDNKNNRNNEVNQNNELSLFSNDFKDIMIEALSFFIEKNQNCNIKYTEYLKWFKKL